VTSSPILYVSGQNQSSVTTKVTPKSDEVNGEDTGSEEDIDEDSDKSEEDEESVASEDIEDSGVFSLLDENNEEILGTEQAIEVIQSIPNSSLQPTSIIGNATISVK
jgi:hypothetical protein